MAKTEKYNFNIINSKHLIKFKNEFSEEHNQTIYTFIDITIENPIFCTHSGQAFDIYTNGDYITYNACYLDNDIRSIISRIGNSYEITRLPSKNKIILSGHCWHPGMICNIDELVEINLINE